MAQDSFTYEQLIDCAHGKLFGDGNARLPAPPMLMFDRITKISDSDGPYGKGKILAELDINPDLWFFDCHFKSDPVMPGCLGLDAMWQLIGFYLGWIGGPGRGRALGGSIKFTGQVLPEAKLLRYELDLKRVISRKLWMGIANGRLYCDDQLIYEAENLKVGLFVNNEF